MRKNWMNCDSKPLSMTTIRYLFIFAVTIPIIIYFSSRINESTDDIQPIQIVRPSPPRLAEVKRHEPEERFSPVPIKTDKSCASISVGKLRFASIPKNMSRMVKQILCILIFHWKKLLLTDKMMAIEKFQSVCENHQWYVGQGVKREDWDDSQGNITKFIIVRDPIDRFTSMFGYVCGDYFKNCGPGMNSIHVTAKLVYECLKFGRKPPGLNDFDQFKHHFEPHTWYCNVGKESDQYKIVHYSQNSEANVKQLQEIFDAAGVQRKYSEPALARMLNHNTHKERDNAQYDEWKAQILKNRTTLAYILAIYDSDYRTFHLERPNFPK